MGTGEIGPSEPSAAPRPAIRPPSLADALLPIASLIVLLALSYAFFGDEASAGPNQVALAFCSLVTFVIARKNGLAWADVRAAALEGVANGLPAIFILLAVGALIGTWAMSGTIVAMVYYGLQVVSPDYFYASTVLICAVIAVTVGSSWTVVGTIGIGLMGIAAAIGASPVVTAGAIISGAYFGDKASPLSDTANLAAAAAGSDIFVHIRESLWTSVPALVLAALGFGLFGRAGTVAAGPALHGLTTHYNVSPWAFLPLGLVFALAVLRAPPAASIFLGALAGGVVAVILNPLQVEAFAAAPHLPRALALLKGVWAALATGYVAKTGDVAIDRLLSRGGMASMMVTVWLIMVALSFGAVLERAGLLRRLIDPVLGRLRGVGSLVTALVGTCIAANILTSDQYIAVVLPGRMFRAEFRRRGLAPAFLSRCVGDSATVTSPLVPWNSCGAYVAAALGVAAVGYAPYCFFNILNPVMTVAFTFVGLRVLREQPATTRDTGSPA